MRLDWGSLRAASQVALEHSLELSAKRVNSLVAVGCTVRRVSFVAPSTQRCTGEKPVLHFRDDLFFGNRRVRRRGLRWGEPPTPAKPGRRHPGRRIPCPTLSSARLRARPRCGGNVGGANEHAGTNDSRAARVDDVERVIGANRKTRRLSERPGKCLEAIAYLEEGHARGKVVITL